MDTFIDIFLIFILAIVPIVTIAAAIIVVRKLVSKRVRLFYWSFALVSGITSFYLSYKYIYFINPNTRVHGWPIPTVIFQRHDESSNWLDFVGWGVYLAYPLNLIICLFLPSFLVIGVKVYSNRNSSNLPNKMHHTITDTF